MKEWKQLENEVGEWAARNFDFHGPQLGMGEEVGELTHAILKNKQGIRKSDQIRELVKDALADATVFLLHLKYLTRTQQRPTDWEEIHLLQIGRLMQLAGSIIQAPNTPELHDRFNLMLEDTAKLFGFNLFEITNDVWQEVSKRDWRKFPKNGLTE